jgi:regulator of protease activity HflC (stomatin/prohibitin superfamily)
MTASALALCAGLDIDAAESRPAPSAFVFRDVCGGVRMAACGLLKSGPCRRARGRVGDLVLKAVSIRVGVFLNSKVKPMHRSLFHLETIVQDDERAFLSRDGRFLRVLEPGRHRLFDPFKRLSVEVFKVVRADFPLQRISVLESVASDVVATYFEVVRTEPGEFALVHFDGEIGKFVWSRNSVAVWKCVTRVSIERLALSELRLDPTFADRNVLTKSAHTLDVQIGAFEAGLLTVDGVVTETLAPGRHVFWQVERKVAVQKYDLRPQLLEVAAQEILTKDRITLRITLTAFYRIRDIQKAAAGAVDLTNALYRLVQFVIREAIASRTLDEILAARQPIDAEVRAYMDERVADLGVEMAELGIKDVILPGDIRELLNKVIEAERIAKANLIRRQEETAATRSLLNTARLMENNPLLLRLKEIEALEKLVEKVGRIDLHTNGTGQGLDALLRGLVRLGEDADARPQA